MPRSYTERLPMETIYEQIDRVRGQLVEEASRLAAGAYETLAGELTRTTQLQRAVAASAGTDWDITFAEGLQARYARHAKLSQMTRDWAAGHGFTTFPDKGFESATITRTAASPPVRYDF